MSDSPKRPWFRFHLVTAVLMMVAAGGLLCANITSGQFAYPRYNFPVAEYVRGWPVIAWNLVPRNYGYVAIFDWPSLLIDVCIWLVCLSSIAVVSGFLIRRRKGRKP